MWTFHPLLTYLLNCTSYRAHMKYGEGNVFIVPFLLFTGGVSKIEKCSECRGTSKYALKSGRVGLRWVRGATTAVRGTQ